LARSPKVPFAHTSAVISLMDFASDTAMLELMLAELESEGAQDVFGPALLDRVRGTIRHALRQQQSPGAKPAGRRGFSRALPQRVRLAARRWVTVKPVMPPLVFAFRAFVVCRMSKLLRLDAASFASGLQSAVNL
jgi:hypothetical protein